MNTIFAAADKSACRRTDQRLLVTRVANMLKLFCTVCMVASQIGCYTPNQRTFENLVHQRVSVGMPVATAVSNLLAIHMQCSGAGPITCDRIRQRLLPSSCLERVVLGNSPAGSLLSKIWKIRSIICAGAVILGHAFTSPRSRNVCQVFSVNLPARGSLWRCSQAHGYHFRRKPAPRTRHLGLARRWLLNVVLNSGERSSLVIGN